MLHGCNSFLIAAGILVIGADEYTDMLTWRKIVQVRIQGTFFDLAGVD